MPCFIYAKLTLVEIWDFDDFGFIILLVQSVINLENIGQKTLEKTEGVVKSGQFRNTSHIGLKS